MNLGEHNSTDVYLASAEDIIIEKLVWYEAGNRISERQIKDVLGVIEIQKDVLDYEYLKSSAKKRHIVELLEDVLHRFDL
ncbi:hypothetical protein K8T06_08785 [bacterium]|nr:hypothetical protein [bacterium]